MRQHKKNHVLKTTLYSICAVCIFVVPIIVYGQTASYQPLTAIPGIPQSGGAGLVTYINAIFLLSVSIGAIIAVVKIAVGGFQYMMSDIVTNKEAAKKDITSALIGLGILLATFVVLNTVYPGLVNLNVLDSVTPVSFNPGPTNPGPTDPCTKYPNGVECLIKKCKEAGGEVDEYKKEIQCFEYQYEKDVEASTMSIAERECQEFIFASNKRYGKVEYKGPSDASTTKLVYECYSRKEMEL